MKVAGLMSGTSHDGIDVAIVELTGRTPGGGDTLALDWSLLGFRSHPYQPEQRRRLRAAAEGAATTADICRLHSELGAWLADALDDTCGALGIETSSLDAVGSHGHTVWHDPPEYDSPEKGDACAGEGASLQIGNPAVLAERVGVPIISDFRSRDLAAGGQGAPLVPFADRLLFTDRVRRRAIQNLGGMGNVTFLPEAGSDEAILAFDTGPGVALLDSATELATGGRLRFDRDGRLAAAGEVDEELLSHLISMPFFDRPPPRSTGREVFGTALVRELAAARGLEERPGGEVTGVNVGGWCDLLATLVEFTARSVGDAYRRWIVPRGVDEVFLTGGGARNPILANAIREQLEPIRVRGGEGLDLDPDAREAVAFAVLAWAHLEGVPGNVPEATGARGPRILGSLTPTR